MSHHLRGHLIHAETRDGHRNINVATALWVNIKPRPIRYIVDIDIGCTQRRLVVTGWRAITKQYRSRRRSTPRCNFNESIPLDPKYTWMTSSIASSLGS